MLCEIIILIRLCRMLAESASSKGRSGVGYGFLMAATWIGCELTGLLIGVIIAEVLSGGNGDPNIIIIAVCGYGLPILAAIALFTIVKNLSDVRDDYQLRERGYERTEWDDRQDYKKRFGSGFAREDKSNEPRPRPENDDDRYRAE